MKLLTTLALSLVLSTSAFASCYDQYSEKALELDTYITNSNYKRAHIEGMVLSSASYTSTAVAVTGASMNPFLAVAILLNAGSASEYVSKKYIDLRISDKTDEVLALSAKLQINLKLLKEARIGKGPTLQQAMSVVNEQISTEISMKQLATAIKELDDQNAFCENEVSLMTHEGIVETAARHLFYSK